MDIKDKQYIKLLNRSYQNSYSTPRSVLSEYVWCNNRKEVDGNQVGTPEYPQYQFPIFITQANRIRNNNGVATRWHLADQVGGNSTAGYYITTAGATSTFNVSFENYASVVPCFHLLADS